MEVFATKVRLGQALSPELPPERELFPVAEDPALPSSNHEHEGLQPHDHGHDQYP